MAWRQTARRRGHQNAMNHPDAAHLPGDESPGRTPGYSASWVGIIAASTPRSSLLKPRKATVRCGRSWFKP